MPTVEEQKLKKLESLLRMVDESLTREEFVKAFEAVVAAVQKADQKHSQIIREAVEDLTNRIEKKLDEFSEQSTKEIAETKQKIDTEGQRVFEEQRQGLNFIVDKVKRIKEGKDGKDGADGKDGTNGTDGKDGSPDTATQVRDKLESLQGDERTDKSAIKGFEELETKLKEIAARPIGRMGMRKVPIIKRYNLSDQVNGTLKAFTLPADTVDVLGVFGSQFPINFNPGTDWTFSGRTLTLPDQISAPQTGETLYCIIETLFYG